MDLLSGMNMKKPFVAVQMAQALHFRPDERQLGPTA
jgi:hypothetical protein